MTFIPRPWARFATMEPTLPIPTIPRVLLQTSVPIYFFFSHLPAFMVAVASGIIFARDIIMAIVCSPVVMVLPPGVFMITMPLLLAASISTLSRPTPARATTLSLSAFSINSCVTLVALLIASPSYSLITPLSSLGVRFVITSTSIPGAFLNISTASFDRLSLTRTFFMKFSPFVHYKSFPDIPFPDPQ